MLFCFQYNDLIKKKGIVQKDKEKITELIAELDQKKNETLLGAYERVNKVCHNPSYPRDCEDVARMN